MAHRLNSLGGQSNCTVPVKRDVNPTINALCILNDMEETDVLKVLVKDIGMFSEVQALGMVGPQVIASTTIRVKQEVDGYLELTPIKWLALNGPPVIQLKVKWSKIGDGLPTPGATTDLVNAWQAYASAPRREQIGENTDVTTDQWCSGVPATAGDPALAGCLGVPATSGAECSGVPASSGDPAPAPTMWGNSSSVFHVDQAVFDLAKPNDFLRTLLRMQEMGGTVHPFNANGRDYSCMGAAFDIDNGQHTTLWGPLQDNHLPAGLEDVHEAMEKFAVKGQANAHWCSGVLVLLAWLKTLWQDSSG